MRTAGLLLMLAGLGLLMAMVVSTLAPGILLTMAAYCLLFAGVFCFAAGVIRRR